MLQKYVVQPNRDDPTDNYLDTRAQELRNDAFNVRLDRSWTNGTSLFGRYSMSDENGFTPENLPGFGAYHDNRVQNLSVTLVNPTSKRLLTETRFGFARMRLHRFGETANGADLVTQLGIPGVGYGGSDAFGLPRFDIQGYDPIGDSLLCTPCRYWNNNFQVGERVTWSLGAHSVRFGGDARRFVWDMLGFFQNRGYFQFTSPITSRTSLADGTGDPLASFLLGTPALAQRQAGTPSMNMRQTTYDAFIQDDWRITPSLTLNAGLRYELQTPLHDISKILTNLDFSNGAPVAFVGGQNGYPSGLVYTDKNNFAPRVGFAWAPNDAKNVIRAGAGIFYAYPDMNLWCNQVHNVPLVFPEIQTNNAATPAINTFGFAPPVLGRTLVGFTAIDTHLQIPRIEQASVSFERQLAVEHHDAGRLSGRVGLEPGSLASREQRAAWARRRAAAAPVSDDLVRAQHGSRAAAGRRHRPEPHVSRRADQPAREHRQVVVQLGLDPGEADVLERAEFSGELHLRRQHDGRPDVPLAGERGRGAAEQLRPAAPTGGRRDATSVIAS